MTFVDILLIIVFLVTIGLGFFKGTIKLMISLVMFYASVVLAGLYFQFLAVLFTRRGTASQVANGISFFLILFVCFAILLVAGLYTFRYLRMPGRLDYLDRILGTAVGLALGVLVIGIISMVLNYIFVQFNPAQTASFPLTGLFQSSVRNSTIRKLMIRNVLPPVYRSVSPFLPDAAVSFFNPSQ